MCGIAAVLAGSGGADGGVASAWMWPDDASKEETAERCHAGKDVDLEDLRAGLQRRGPDAVHVRHVEASGGQPSVTLVGAVLHMRGDKTVEQPAKLGSRGESWLLFNGEIFRSDGKELVRDGSDTAFLQDRLGPLCDSTVVSAAAAAKIRTELQTLEGPWAVVIWHGPSQSLLVAKDPLGRRSLLWRRSGQGQLAIASIVPKDASTDWHEVPPGGVTVLQARGRCFRLERTHEDCIPPPHKELVDGKVALLESARMLTSALSDAVRVRVQSHLEPGVGVLFSGGLDCTVLAALAHLNLEPGCPIDLINVCFDEAHGHRSPDRLTAIASFQELVRVFPERKWNLVCVNRSADDIAANEQAILRLIAPKHSQMDFNIGASLWFASEATGVLWKGPDCEADGPAQDDEGPSKEDALASLLGQKPQSPATKEAQQHPKASTGVCALQLEGSRCGGVAKAKCILGACAMCCKRQRLGQETQARVVCRVHKSKAEKREVKKARISEKSQIRQQAQQREDRKERGQGAKPGAYNSPARILLSGIGADEQLGGYGRHRVAFRTNGWEGLRKELATDVARLWERNLGRDDRCISDRAREVRQPFLDARVMAAVRSMPLEHIADPTLGQGVGDKRLLRLVCLQLGMVRASQLEKRAIQFGSRIVHATRSWAAGSNRSLSGADDYCARAKQKS
ncbi:Asparagine synthetase domain-containing protein 1 [Durusdinium trenchii]|uniref:Asparagine synthetase domain-containing protein 1 n=1 Tax=Durusdinium trenchii TaxID=1381693 RepID=A0ABP0QXC2_9DINO